MQRLTLFLILPVIGIGMAHGQVQYGDLILENYESGGPELRDVSSPPYPNRDLAWAVGVNGTVMKRISEGQPWQETTLLDGQYDFNGVHFVSENTGWIVGEKNAQPNKFQGIILKTTNGGSNWTVNHTFSAPLYDVYFPSSSEGWVACADGYVLTTRNGGQSWYTWFVEEAEDSISNAFLSVWAVDGSKAWVCGDHSGVVAKTTDGGTNWTCYYPFSRVYPGAIEGYLTNFSVAGPNPANFNEVYVTCSQGLIGHTTDGGASWSTEPFESDDQWFYTGWLSSYPFLAAGSSEMFIDITHYYNWKDYGKGYDLLGSTSICDFVAGTNSAILWHYPNDVTIEDEITSIEATGGYRKVTVNWSGSCGAAGTYYFYVYRGLTSVGPFTLKHTKTYSSPGYHFFNLSWDDNSVDFEQPYWYTVVMSYGITRVPPDDGIPTGRPDPPIPSRPGGFTISEIGGDQGWKLGLNWNLVSGVDTYYVYRRPNPGAPDELHYIGCTVTGKTGEFEYIDDLALPGYTTYYEVRSYNGCAVSSAATGTGVSLDDLSPPKVSGVRATYDESEGYIDMDWSPVSDPTLGGYWVKYLYIATKNENMANDAPLVRCFDRFPAAFSGGYIELQVRAMDRSENWGTWSDAYYIGEFMRGDANSDGRITIADATFLVSYIYRGGPPPSCMDAGDANDDGVVAYADALYIKSYCFEQGPPPPEPFPDCGYDPTMDGIGCASYEPCEAKGASASGTSDCGGSLWLGEPALDGRRLSIPVYLDNVKTLHSFSWEVGYDPRLLSAEDVDNTGLVTERFDFFGFCTDKGQRVKAGALASWTMDLVLAPGEYQIATMIFELMTDDVDVREALRLDYVELVDTTGTILDAGCGGGAMSSFTVLSPHDFDLSSQPNPFTTEATIAYSIPKSSQVTLEIYDSSGRLVRTLVSEEKQPGRYTAHWDGTADRGGHVSAGVYFYKLTAGEFTSVKKMVLLR